MKDNKKPIIVYWSPNFGKNNGEDLEFFYPKPKSLYLELINKKNNTAKNNTSFFSCPAFKDLTKKILLFESPMSFSNSFKFHDDNNIEIMQNSKNTIEFMFNRPQTITNGPTVSFILQNIFFSEEPLETLFTAPYFHESKYTRYGSVIPGKFDIGRWFRPYNFEVQLWSNNTDFIIEEDEPLFYVHFQTDRPVIIKRFHYTEDLEKAAIACIKTTKTFGLGQSLLSRYNRFNSTGMRNKILHLIKQNIIDEEEIIKL